LWRRGRSLRGGRELRPRCWPRQAILVQATICMLLRCIARIFANYFMHPTYPSFTFCKFLLLFIQSYFYNWPLSKFRFLQEYQIWPRWLQSS
jgi:hypothetical protein